MSLSAGAPGFNSSIGTLWSIFFFAKCKNFFFRGLCGILSAIELYLEGEYTMKKIKSSALVALLLMSIVTTAITESSYTEHAKYYAKFIAMLATLDVEFGDLSDDNPNEKDDGSVHVEVSPIEGANLSYVYREGKLTSASFAIYPDTPAYESLSSLILFFIAQMEPEGSTLEEWQAATLKLAQENSYENDIAEYGFQHVGTHLVFVAVLK